MTEQFLFDLVLSVTLATSGAMLPMILFLVTRKALRSTAGVEVDPNELGPFQLLWWSACAALGMRIREAKPGQGKPVLNRDNHYIDAKGYATSSLLNNATPSQINWTEAFREGDIKLLPTGWKMSHATPVPPGHVRFFLRDGSTVDVKFRERVRGYRTLAMVVGDCQVSMDPVKLAEWRAWVSDCEATLPIKPKARKVVESPPEIMEGFRSLEQKFSAVEKAMKEVRPPAVQMETLSSYGDSITKALGELKRNQQSNGQAIDRIGQMVTDGRVEKRVADLWEKHTKPRRDSEPIRLLQKRVEEIRTMVVNLNQTPHQPASILDHDTAKALAGAVEYLEQELTGELSNFSDCCDSHCSLDRPCCLPQKIRAGLRELKAIASPEPDTCWPERLRFGGLPERIFFKKWLEQEKQHSMASHLVSRNKRVATRAEQRAICSTIQWLGTNCGRAFIADCESEIRKHQELGSLTGQRYPHHQNELPADPASGIVSMLVEDCLGLHAGDDVERAKALVRGPIRKLLAFSALGLDPHAQVTHLGQWTSREDMIKDRDRLMAAVKRHNEKREAQS